MGTTNEKGATADCVNASWEAIGLDGEVVRVESANDEIIRILQGLVPPEYLAALRAGSDTSTLLEGLRVDLPTRTNILQLSDRYRGNLAIARSYREKREHLSKSVASDLAACRTDAGRDQEALDNAIDRLVNAKFQALAKALVDRPELADEFSLYHYEGEGGFSLRSRVLGTNRFEGEDEGYEPEIDALFFPIDHKESIFEAAAYDRGYFFSPTVRNAQDLSGNVFELRNDEGAWNSARLDWFLKLTPDDVLKHVRTRLELIRERIKRNSANMEAAKTLVQMVNKDRSLPYSLEIVESRRGDTIEFRSRAIGTFLTYFTIPRWRVSPSGELEQSNADNKLDMEYIRRVAAELKKKKKL
ncbi:MAG TPA: hypothetical protein PK765_06300 [bacterium]|nr:hypothetical protein [bacterium]